MEMKLTALCQVMPIGWLEAISQVRSGRRPSRIMKTEERRLVWRFIGSVVAIAVIIGAAIGVTHWTGPLG